MKIIHQRIAKVARALAAEAYECALVAGVIDRRLERARARYVDQHFADFIPYARKVLTQMLAKDYTFEIANGQHTAKTVEAMKEEIYEALLIDGSFKAPAPLESLSPANEMPA